MKPLDLLTVLAFALASLGCAAELKVASEIEEEQSPITWSDCSQEIGDHPCELALTSQEEEVWSLYDNYGKIIVLDFSTEWCGYCRIGASTIQEIQDQYSADDVVIVTILIEDSYGSPADLSLIQAWANYYAISAPVLAGSRDLLSSDPEQGWPVTGYPSYFFVGRDMTLKFKQTGYSDDGLRATIDAMLLEDPISES